MKALICHAFGPIDQLRVEDMPDLVPGPGEVVLRVRAAGVNFPDALIVQNLYQFKPTPPFSPGGESAGQVLAVGEGVTRFKVGDAAIALTIWGGFAEQVRVREDQLFALPEGMPFEVAGALLLTYGTCLHALRDRANLQAGQTVLVLGAAGGIGTATIELAKAMGARVIAAASTAEKLDLCRRLGADECINYREQNLRDELKRLTGGQGVDVVMEHIGGEVFTRSLACLRTDGTMVTVGAHAGEVVPLDIIPFFRRQLRLVGSKNASLAELREVMTMVADGRLKPVIHATFPLEEAAQAHRAVGSRALFGKVLLKP
jgi:NADPH2:quinone reductase